MRQALLALAACSVGVAAAPVLEVHVDPRAGDDLAPATREQPVQSVHAAAERVRVLLAAHAAGAHVAVWLAPGVHNVGTAPLRLGAGDGPATWGSADPSRPASISAAVRVTGWKADAARPGVLAAPIPAALPQGGALRHLWVGGERALKPRYYPARGSLSIVENASATLPWGGYQFNATIDPSLFKNPQHVEFVYTGRAGARGSSPSGERDDQSGEDPWTEMRCTIDSVRAPGSVALKRPCFMALPFAGAEDTGRTRGHQVPAYLENVDLAFTSPGQWYLDSAAGSILYRLRPGETLSDVERTATTALNSTLLVLDGARNLRWEHVRFEYAVWNAASGPFGFVDIQSAQIFNGSVLEASTLQLTAVRNVSFSSCDFRRLGGVYAIAAEGGSHGVTIENSSFTDCSGGGLMFGSVANCSTGCANGPLSQPGSNPGADSGMGNQWWPKPDTPVEQQDRGLLVTNSLFEGIPTEFHAGNAIFVGYARDVELSHNSISNTSYSAICIGGGWPKKPSYGRNVRVVYNHIQSFMQLLADVSATVHVLQALPDWTPCISYQSP